jgi:hypothetical protein
MIDLRLHMEGTRRFTICVGRFVQAIFGLVRRSKYLRFRRWQ